MKIMLFTWFAVVWIALEGFAAQSVTPQMARTLEAVQVALAAEDWDAAITALKKHKGEKNALWYNTLGQVYLAQEKTADAEEPLREAYKRDKDPVYGVTLAVCLHRLEQIDEALELFGRHIDLAACEQGELESYLSLAVQVDDPRLARELTRFGMMRFPQSRYLREMDLRQVMEGGRPAEIERASDAMLLKEPAEARWWSVRSTGVEADDQRFAALEAAALASPGDVVVVRRHMGAQLSAGHGQEALRTAAFLMGKEIGSDTKLQCVQAAVLMEDYNTASQWLAQVEPSDDKSYWRVKMVVALRAGNFDEADAALAALLKFSEPNVALWSWAARIAVEAPSPKHADQWLTQGVNLDPNHTTPIALDHARWLIQEGQLEVARDVIVGYLETHPSDATALALQQLVASP